MFLKLFLLVFIFSFTTINAEDDNQAEKPAAAKDNHDNTDDLVAPAPYPEEDYQPYPPYDDSEGILQGEDLDNYIKSSKTPYAAGSRNAAYRDYHGSPVKRCNGCCCDCSNDGSSKGYPLLHDNEELSGDETVDPVYPGYKPPQDICTLPKVVGPCKARIKMYFYNSATGKCEVFYYGGCQGNANRFSKIEKCQERCEKK